MFEQDDNGTSISYEKDNPKDKQNFTLCHELGHFLLKHEGIYFTETADTQELSDEREANVFSAVILMPDIVLLSKIYYSCASFEQVQESLSVSKQALYFRLLDLIRDYFHDEEEQIKDALELYQEGQNPEIHQYFDRIIEYIITEYDHFQPSLVNKVRRALREKDMVTSQEIPSLLNEGDWDLIKQNLSNVKVWLIYNKGKTIAYAWNSTKLSDQQARKKSRIKIITNVRKSMMYQPDKLKERRKALKLTQKDIAEKLGISYQAYSAWERGVKEPSTEKVSQLEKLLTVPKGYFTEIEIVRLYNTLSLSGKEKVVTYAGDLVQEESQSKFVSISEKRFEYHVYERMSAGIGASVYDDRNYDTVYFTEELAHDFALWVSGDFMEPKYHNGSVALIRETGFDYDGAVYAVVFNSKTYIKRVYREADGLRLKYKDIFISYDEDPRVVRTIIGNFIPLR